MSDVYVESKKVEFVKVKQTRNDQRWCGEWEKKKISQTRRVCSSQKSDYTVVNNNEYFK